MQELFLSYAIIFQEKSSFLHSINTPIMVRCCSDFSMFYSNQSRQAKHIRSKTADGDCWLSFNMRLITLAETVSI